MRGTILGLDADSGMAQVAGEDGQRYAFPREQWKLPGEPRIGQEVDFQAEGTRALSVFGLGAGKASAPATQCSSVRAKGHQERLVAALLAFFLGVFGVHKFYMGKTRAGVIMLLCTFPGALLLGIPTAIVALIAFVEFVIYLVTDDEVFERRYIEGDKSWF